MRYVTFAVVTLFILSIFLENLLPAIGGAAVLAAIVGFGAQSFLRDIIAGFFILFEGQYNVGDFITVEPTKASEMVEEVGLRTTKIRALSGEVVYVPNGTLTGVTNYVSGLQRHRRGAAEKRGGRKPHPRRDARGPRTLPEPAAPYRS